VVGEEVGIYEGKLVGTEVGELEGIAQKREHKSRGHSPVGMEVGTTVGVEEGT